MIEGNILRNFSSYQSDNGSDSSFSYRSPKISNEEQMEFSSQNWIQPCIKDRENLNFFSADSDGDSPANDCYSQVSEAACQKDFDNNIAEIAHPPSPLIFSQWTEDNVDYI